MGNLAKVCGSKLQKEVGAFIIMHQSRESWQTFMVFSNIEKTGRLAAMTSVMAVNCILRCVFVDLKLKMSQTDDRSVDASKLTIIAKSDGSMIERRKKTYVASWLGEETPLFVPDLDAHPLFSRICSDTFVDFNSLCRVDIYYISRMLGGQADRI